MLAEVDCNDPTTSRVKMKMVGYATEKSCNSGVVAALKSYDIRCTSTTSRFIKAMRNCSNLF